MFGAIVSCTDPIAVVALLKELGASKKFNTVIEGESLLNDATGLIMYTISLQIYRGGSATFSNIVGMFISLTLGGAILGVVVGLITAFFAKKFLNDTIMCINATLLSGFIAFFFAETVFAHMGFAISGIMTLISLGLFMS